MTNKTQTHGPLGHDFLTSDHCSRCFVEEHEGEGFHEPCPGTFFAPICPRCECRDHQHTDTYFLRGLHGGLLYKCRRCRKEFYG